MSIHLLRCITVGYLLLPNLLFFTYWTRTSVAFFGVLILGFLFFEVIKNREFSKTDILNQKSIISLVIISLVATLISGVTGICFQTLDHWAHNTKINELFVSDWPQRIPLKGPVVSYYYGYYVVPVLLSKWVGQIREDIIFIWTAFGFFLGFAWLYLALNRKMIFVILALSVGDTPRFLKLIFSNLGGRLYEFGDFAIEPWSNFENLFWVPNQVIPTFIIAGMFVYVLKNKINVEYLVLPVALSFWWAVFPSVTSGTIIGIVVLKKWIVKNLDLDWAQVIKLVVLPFVTCLPVLLFYLSHEHLPASGFVWEFSGSFQNRMLEYSLNIGLNLVLFTLVYLYFQNKISSTLPVFPIFITLCVIMFFPLFRIGKLNDFLFRGLMPCLLVAGIYLFYPIAAVSNYKKSWALIRKSPYSFIIILLLVSSSMIAGGRLFRAVTVNQITTRLFPEKVAFKAIPYDEYSGIYEALQAKWTQEEADQYLGKKDSFYELNMSPLNSR